MKSLCANGTTLTRFGWGVEVGGAAAVGVSPSITNTSSPSVPLASWSSMSSRCGIGPGRRLTRSFLGVTAVVMFDSIEAEAEADRSAGGACASPGESANPGGLPSIIGDDGSELVLR